VLLKRVCTCGCEHFLGPGNSVTVRCFVTLAAPQADPIFTYLHRALKLVYRFSIITNRETAFILQPTANPALFTFSSTKTFLLESPEFHWGAHCPQPIIMAHIQNTFGMLTRLSCVVPCLPTLADNPANALSAFQSIPSSRTLTTIPIRLSPRLSELDLHAQHGCGGGTPTLTASPKART
jgi:hypothetical protein